MMKRQGTCNYCGECCGYPRSDGVSINPWPKGILSMLGDWREEDVNRMLPICRILRHPQYGGAMEGEGFCYSPEHGLTRSMTDLRCPFLNEQRMCALVGTENESVFTEYCLLSGPAERMSAWQVQRFQQNCPSCSYSYRHIEE